MIFRKALISITRQLDIVSQENDKRISSNEKLKSKGLECLLSLVDDAPQYEFEKFVESEDYDILLGYLLNVLCTISKYDKSRQLRLHALNVMVSVFHRVKLLHESNKTHERCCIKPIVSALPGVSSSLFKLVMSDTKLPSKLMVQAIGTLSEFLRTAFSTCDHQSKCPLLEGENLAQTCDNIAIRFGFLINYVLNHSSNLSQDVKFKVLDLCDTIVTGTRAALLQKTLKSIIRYAAFLNRRSEAHSNVILIISHLKDKILANDETSLDLQSSALTCMFDIVDNLEKHHSTMLIEERESELSMLSGFFRLFPTETLNIAFEDNERRLQFLHTMTTLAQFSTQQPFLFLTESRIDDKALENSDGRVYTVEKRFTNLSSIELDLMSDCFREIGKSLNWLCIEDMFRNELRNFNSASNLFITHLLLKGCLDRLDLDNRCSRFAMILLDSYIDCTHEKYLKLKSEAESDRIVYSQDVLEIVIAVETQVTIAELYHRSQKESKYKTLILKRLSWMLLNWSSSNSRAVSEASINALTKLSILYECDSIKSLITANIDYIADGVNQLLGDFNYNSEVTNVLATALKLSSSDTFYYFQDIYERIFKLLGVYHQTEKSKTIALLFYRTLLILSEWKGVQSESEFDGLNLSDAGTLATLKKDLSIDQRMKKLSDRTLGAELIKRKIDSMRVTEMDEHKLIEDIRQNRIEEPAPEAMEPAEEEPKEILPVEAKLTEKILGHCVHLVSSNNTETKILALKAASCGLKILHDYEDTLLPLVHQLWSPLVSRLTSNYSQNLELSLCAFECLVVMAVTAKDFIKRRTLDTIIPRLCLFLESQSKHSRGKKEYGPYCMTIAYKSQLRILNRLGSLAYHIQLAYSSLWRVVKATLLYLDNGQVPPLRDAARTSLHYLIALDADCVWYFAKQARQLDELPFELIYETNPQDHIVVSKLKGIAKH